ncbi:MAG: YggS family pyridoxal phosphate-dependent enzyme [Sphingomicrobium sp.]
MASPADRLAHVRQKIDRACKVARRPVSSVETIAVSKTRAVEQIEPLIAAGQLAFGESRIQEAEAKWPALRQRLSGLTLHMIGRLQSNKAAEAVALFDVIHSLDRPSLLDALVASADKAGRFPPCFVQVNIGAEAQKGGVAIAGLGGFLDRVRASPLPLAGLMCIPPAGHEAAPYFALCQELAKQHGLTGLSMGMSADYPTAILLGATIIRVGAALFED